jgi:hypothetical protein
LSTTGEQVNPGFLGISDSFLAVQAAKDMMFLQYSKKEILLQKHFTYPFQWEFLFKQEERRNNAFLTNIHTGLCTEKKLAYVRNFFKAII